jgi:hypothetical protein
MNILKYIPVIIVAMLLTACNYDDGQSSEKNGSTEQQESKTGAVEYNPEEIVPDTVMYITLNDSLRDLISTMGKRMAYTTQAALKGELKHAIQQGGLMHAVEFCSKRAMVITDSMSVAYKHQIRRLAKKNRNPDNAMNENESNLYKSYVLNFIGGMPPMETVLWNEEGNPVYYYPIFTDAVCLNCHGTVGQEINPDVAEKIAAIYPDDLATGFRKDDPRGMWAITFPEYRVTGVE